MPASQTAAALVAIGLAGLLPGCASLGKPAWLEPGPARAQQRRAVRFDPFQQTDVRHDHLSTMDGTRPRDYAEPVVEVKRPRWWDQPLTPTSRPAVTDSPIYR
ncbi:MAG: hypothetical protein ACK5SI_13350 [Planctomycetia bacterium]|jgi:hypothetical protein